MKFEDNRPEFGHRLQTENYRPEIGNRLENSQDKQAGKKARDTELETRPRKELDKKSQREKVEIKQQETTEQGLEPEEFTACSRKSTAQLQHLQHWRGTTQLSLLQ